MTALTISPTALPRIALTIGIVGHRAEKIAKTRADIAATLNTLLRQISTETSKACPPYQAKYHETGPVDFSSHCPYCPDEPLISVISCFASGTDLLGAQAARDCGLELDAVLPFSLEDGHLECQADGEEKNYDKLTTAARSMRILGQARASHDLVSRQRAFDLAGRIMLAQSDILIAVWDGGLSAGRGGTRDCIDQALRLGIPVIHILSTDPTQVDLLSFDDNKTAYSERHVDDAIRHRLAPGADGRIEAIGKLLDQLIKPFFTPIDSQGAAPAHSRSLLKSLDKNPDKNHGKNHRHEDCLAMKIFLEDQGKIKNVDQTAVRKEMERLLALLKPFGDKALPGNNTASSLSRLFTAFATADTLANFYATRFRWAVRVIFIAAAASLILAALSTLDPHMLHIDPSKFHLVLGFFELAALAVMVWTTVDGRKKHIHRRWIDARDIAERVRLSSVFWTLGIWPWPLSETKHWIGWYVRGHLREQALCDTRDGKDWFHETKGILGILLNEQIGYHKKTTEKMHRISTILERVTFGCLLIASAPLALVVMFEGFGLIFGYKEMLPHWIADALPFWTLSLSAIAFAIFGIKSTLDYDGIADRSARSVKALEEAQKSLETLSDIADLHNFASHLGLIMHRELRHWRATAESRVLDMPG